MIQPNIEIPELISLTELRYKTKKLQKILSKKDGYIILTSRGKKIAVIYPAHAKTPPVKLVKPPTYNMGKMKTSLRRKDIYKDYIDRKYHEKSY